MRRSGSFLATLAAAALFGWTPIGESANPAIVRGELAALPGVCPVAGCAEADFDSRWLSRTSQGHLFLVSRQCGSAACDGWLVEKTAQGLVTRLVFQGQMRVERQAPATYPSVVVRRDVNDHTVSEAQFDWVAGRYVQAASRELYRVNGTECGDAGECYARATQAWRERQGGEALRIWETVHNRSVI
jgi:hypothetical protein